MYLKYLKPVSAKPLSADIQSKLRCIFAIARSPDSDSVFACLEVVVVVVFTFTASTAAVMLMFLFFAVPIFATNVAVVDDLVVAVVVNVLLLLLLLRLLNNDAAF